MGYKHGLRNKCYVGAVLHSAESTITWLELDLAESVGNDDTRDEAEIVNRRGDFKLYGAGKRALSYTLPCTYDPADSAIALILAAYQNNTPLAFADMDGDIETAGTKGMYLDISVMKAPKPSELNAYDTIEFEFRPSAESDFEPEFVTIAEAPTTTTP